ncbi:ATP-binding protein [Thermopolyspora sp. NPDC052614]|uniref:ATP-binding protein n=1 Tax=Thermopolyspora sp. NPDC052614 TaxID=3155682 RepID=UPI00342565CE
MTGTTGRHYLELPAEPSSVSCAREHVAVVLASFGLTSRELIDDAQLITSELVTNAITASVAGASGNGDGHASALGKRVRVSVRMVDARLVLEFWDDGAGVPKQRTPDDYEVRGRGLFLVEALCNRWGYHRPTPGEKIVWVELDVEPYLCEPATPC